MTAASPRDLLLAPAAFVPAMAARRLFWPPIAAAMAAGLLLAAVALPRLDLERAALDRIESRDGGAQPTPNELEGELRTARRVGTLAAYAGAALGPWLSALGVALALWLAFKVAGGRPGFAGTFTVAAWGLVPGAVRALLSVPAALARSSIPPAELGRLLPSAPGALLPAGASGPLASLLWSLDLFSLWAVAIVAAGMAPVAGVGPRRALAVVALLWLSQVAVLQVALPALGGAR
jgi:hypothetical protein